MLATSGKANECNRSVMARLNYLSAPPTRGFGIGKTVYCFAMEART
jgi:hypothetical protein